MNNKNKVFTILGIVLIAIGMAGTVITHTGAMISPGEEVGGVKILDAPSQVAPGTGFTVTVEAWVYESTYEGEYKIQAYPYGGNDTWSGSKNVELDTSRKEIEVSVSAPDDERQDKLTMGGVKTGYSSNYLGSESQIIQIGEEDSDAPTASFTYTPKNPDNEEKVTFDGTESKGGDGSITKHYFGFDDGEAETGEVVEHSYDKAGEYQATLYVWNDEDKKHSTMKTITVGEGDEDENDTSSPEASFSFSPDNPRTGEEVELDASESESGETGEDITEYNWDINGETLDGESVNHTFEEEGTHSVTLSLVQSDGSTDSITKDITVESVSDPVARISTSTRTAETGEQITFSASESEPISQSSVEIESYEWTFSDGTTKEGEKVSHSWDEPGDQSVNLKITTDYGTTDESTVSVTINEEKLSWPIPVEASYVMIIVGLAMISLVVLSRRKVI